MNPNSFNLDELIDGMAYPCSGSDVVNACSLLLPNEFCTELSSKISKQNFNNSYELRMWFSENITTHMAGLLGGATVTELIEKGKKAA